jgi:hypothetical protein
MLNEFLWEQLLFALLAPFALAWVLPFYIIPTLIYYSFYGYTIAYICFWFVGALLFSMYLMNRAAKAQKQQEEAVELMNNYLKKTSAAANTDDNNMVK